MAAPTRSHTTLRKQLKEFDDKTAEEYDVWYKGLNDEERPFIDTTIQAFNARIKASEEEALKLKSPKAPDSQREGTSNPLPDEITEAEISAMWTSIDAADVSSLDQESLKIFEYQGFDPKAILISLMKAKKTQQCL
jgi:hypothetical protein